MARGDPVFSTGSRHANDFLRSEVGGKKREARHPGRHRTARRQKLRTRPHEPLQDEANSQDESEVDNHDQIINPLKLARGIHIPGELSDRGLALWTLANSGRLIAFFTESFYFSQHYIQFFAQLELAITSPALNRNTLEGSAVTPLPAQQLDSLAMPTYRGQQRLAEATSKSLG
jgi:hypothetical protein